LSLHVEQFVTSSYRQNCYVAANGDGEALVVDPGSDIDGIIDIISNNDWRPQAVIATHAHFDHVGAVVDVMEHFDIPFYLHGKDQPLLRRMNLFKMVVEKGPALRVPEITHDLVEMTEGFCVGNFKVEVLTTPGHTPGGICFIIENNIFTGDTVLPKGVGRTDLPGGNAEDLKLSITALGELPGELTAHPGHGPSMALGDLLDMAAKAGTAGMKNI
jgi:hydroxyacylglutathione hydrolase